MIKKISVAVAIILSALYVTLQVISMLACKKETKGEGTAAAKEQALKIISGNGSFPCDMPTVEDGILTFADTTQYFCYENFLTQLVDGGEDDAATDSPFASMSEDEKLAYVENTLGFQSLRAEKLAAFEAQNATGWPTSEAIPDEDWIASRIRRSMLNTGREVRIGNYIEKHVSREYLITLDASQSELLMALRALPADPTVEQLLNLDLNRDYMWISSMLHPDEVYTVNERPTGTEPGGGGINPGQAPVWTINGTPFQPNLCSAYGIVSFSGFTASRNDVPQKCSYHIDYGDGTTSGTTTDPDKVSTIGTNQSIVAAFTHHYPQGNYTATVTIKSISPYNSVNAVVKTKTYAINIGTQALWCTNSYRGQQILKGINSTTNLKGVITYKTWHPFPFGEPRTKIYGSTELHQLSNGVWRRVKNNQTNLCVELRPTFSDKNCTALTSGSYNQPVAGCSKNTNAKEIERKPPSYNNDVLWLQKLSAFHSFTTTGLSGSFEQSIIICQ